MRAIILFSLAAVSIVALAACTPAQEAPATVQSGAAATSTIRGMRHVHGNSDLGGLARARCYCHVSPCTYARGDTHAYSYRHASTHCNAHPYGYSHSQTDAHADPDRKDNRRCSNGCSWPAHPDPDPYALGVHKRGDNCPDKSGDSRY